MEVYVVTAVFVGYDNGMKSKVLAVFKDMEEAEKLSKTYKENFKPGMVVSDVYMLLDSCDLT
jgi:hypothetical protein